MVVAVAIGQKIGHAPMRIASTTTRWSSAAIALAPSVAPPNSVGVAVVVVAAEKAAAPMAVEVGAKVTMVATAMVTMVAVEVTAKVIMVAAKGATVVATTLAMEGAALTATP